MTRTNYSTKTFATPPSATLVGTAPENLLVRLAREARRLASYMKPEEDPEFEPGTGATVTLTHKEASDVAEEIAALAMLAEATLYELELAEDDR